MRLGSDSGDVLELSILRFRGNNRPSSQVRGIVCAGQGDSISHRQIGPTSRHSPERSPEVTSKPEAGSRQPPGRTG